MSLANGKGTGSVTFIRKGHFVVVKRSAVIEMYHDGATGFYIRQELIEKSVLVGSSGSRDASVRDEMYDSILLEDCDIIWSLENDVWRRTPDKTP